MAETETEKDWQPLVHCGGLWRDSLWRTYDLLKGLAYTGYNVATHTPSSFRRRRVFAAYCEFRDFVTQDRWFGMLGITAILNHAYRHQRFELVRLGTEGSRAGFWGAPSPGESGKGSGVVFGRSVFQVVDRRPKKAPDPVARRRPREHGP
ncbi:MAG: hypothetical protein KJ000_18000, partial [Pirellulaceae bacterium]|nr:hypothetical protein [Pirellulaceae bacterium]